MTGYACYCELRHAHKIGLFATREQARGWNPGRSDQIAEVCADKHVRRLDKPVFFDAADQSYPQLRAAIELLNS